MRKIGIDKRDPSYRHFYYDDSKILTSNPPKYEIHYVDDINDTDYVECNYVVKIKDAPEETVIESVEINNENLTITLPTEQTENKIINKNSEPKKRGRKKKEETEYKNIEIHEIKQSQINLPIQNNIKYEYTAFNLDFSSSNELVDLLNNYGEDGWELCGCELYNEGIIFDKKKIFCIMKKIKGLD